MRHVLSWFVLVFTTLVFAGCAHFTEQPQPDNTNAWRDDRPRDGQ